MSNRKSLSNNASMISAFVILGIIIFIVSLIGAYVMKPEPETIIGEVEVDEMRISSKIASRVSKIKVKEGQTVKAGDTLIVLDSPELEAKLQQANSVVNAASAVSNKAQKGAREEQIRGAYEMWQKAIAAEEVWQKSYDRVKSLYEKNVITAQKFDETEAQYKAAVAQTKAAKSQYDLAVNGAQEEDKEAAAAKVRQAKGVVTEVKSYLKETVLTAPIDGKISSIFPMRGELVGSGAPLMNLQDMTSAWVSFNIRERDYSKMSEGKTITATIPALDNKEIRLRVVGAKDRGSFAAWKATKTKGEYDSKTFEIKAIPTETIENLIPGMTVVLKDEAEEESK